MGIKISELPQASALTDSDVIPIVQSGDTKKIAVNNIITNSHNTSQNTTYSSNYIDSNFNKVNVINEESSSTTDTYSANFINEKIPAVKTSRDTSTTDAYSCNYVNGLFEYSTSEQRVGTWIDGKPLYRKVVPIGNLADFGAKIVPHNISNLGQVTHFEVIWQDSGMSWYSNIRWDSSSVLIKSYIEGANIQIECLGFNWAGRTANAVCTIEYTKTTD